MGGEMKLLALVLMFGVGLGLELEAPGNEKELKKLLRTKTNVLVLFEKEGSATPGSAKWRRPMMEAAKNVYGQGTLAVVSCADSDGRKLCKKLKVSPEPFAVKHYKDGEFHKDYDRLQTAASLTRFMLDPSGDAPWEEDPSGADVKHVQSTAEWKKLLKSETKPILAMFYAPWCGYCKRMKPAFAEAATAAKSENILAAADVTRAENADIARMYKVEGYPTILYFQGGKKKLAFGGENSKEGILAWLKDPRPAAEKPKEVAWSEEASDVAHLTVSTFPAFLAENPSVVVMFYAPWCGHCKKMKPDYVAAAAKLKEEGQSGRLAAVDATVEKALAEQFEIKGFPTLKYFKEGQFAWDLTSERTADAILNFMRSPSEPPPPPPPEVPWEEMDTNVLHLASQSFKSELKRRKHALVMFYAPWCGHCKAAKPAFNEAAEELKEEGRVALAAVDCTQHNSLCEEHGVRGFPTLKYFVYGKNAVDYNGGRDKEAFVGFIREKMGGGGDGGEGKPPAAQPPPSPADDWSIDGGDKVLRLGAQNFAEELSKLETALVMFYAPWCGHCKRAKPDFAKAALGASDGAGLAAVDCTVERELCSEHSVKGYPTLKVFKKGVFANDYMGARTAENFLAAAEGKAPPKEANEESKAKPDVWTDKGAEFVMILTPENFQETMDMAKSALVFFYAPWCGHCKKAKPAFAEAATELKEGCGMMAMDCSVYRDFCQSHNVKGYPTIQVWKKGKFSKKYEGARSVEAFRAAANGEAPPAEPPAPVDSWDGLEGAEAVLFPEPEQFPKTMAEFPSALVFFYAPWCGHCKKAKPDFAKAAAAADKTHGFVAVDCTRHKELCAEKSIRGYPTIQIWKDGVFQSKYNGPRTQTDFLQALQSPAKDEL